VFQQAFHVMRSGRPGPVLIDLPFDVQMAEIEFDIDTYEPLPVYRPHASVAQIDQALNLLATATKPLIVAGGGVINADAADLLQAFAEVAGIPVIPTLMGWGSIPDDHPLMAGMVGLQTSHRYGNATMLASDFVFGVGNRWANRHTGTTEVYTKGRRFVHIDVEPTQIGRVFEPTLGIASCAKSALALLVDGVRARQAAGTWPDFSEWAGRCAERKRVMLRETHFTQVPMKPLRVYEEMNQVFGRDTVYVSTIGLSQIAAAQFLHVYAPRQWINCGQAGPLGWTIPAALGVAVAQPNRTVVGISGDYDFQFLIEELAVGAQFSIPYVHVLVNNSYLGLIRQSQRGFDMDYCVQLAFENQNIPPEAEGNLRSYGVDHVAVVQGLGCQALRVTDPEKVQAALRQAQQMARQYQVPVVVECILERVTNIAMGTDIDKINEFEAIDCRAAQGLATEGLLD
jgi:tartronate-semialdehyde synthase